MVGSPQPVPEGEFESQAAVRSPPCPTHVPGQTEVRRLLRSSAAALALPGASLKAPLFFSGGVESCCCCWSGVKSSLELLENWRSVVSLLTHHKTVLLLPPVPHKSEPFHLASARPGLGATGNQTCGRSHAKSFGELLKKELGSALVSSRMREGNVSSLFVVWQPESFLLLSLETSFFYICVIPGMFLLRAPLLQPGSVSRALPDLEGLRVRPWASKQAPG